MTFNYNAVDEILTAIFPLPEEFGLDDKEPLNFKLIQNQIKNVDIYAHINFGISKMVIISPNFNNIVIKIPFKGTWYKAEWLPFKWANGSDCSDYCLTEYEKYCQLKKYGLNCFVTKTIPYKTINNIRIFIQEKVIPEEDTCFSSDFIPSLKSKELARKWKEEGQSIFDTFWFANCLDKYGQSKVQRFLYYCNNIDLDILEDIHEGNYGYRENGTPVILDYSNFSH